MDSEKLNKKEKDIIKSCLKAALDGPFFPDWEFQTLFGLTKDELRIVLENYPNVKEYCNSQNEKNDSWLAINNTLNNLLRYPHRKESEWDKWIPVSKEELLKIYKKWRD